MSYSYDQNSNGTSIVYPSGTSISYLHADASGNTLNRVLEVEEGAQTIASFQYIGPARIEKRSYGNGTETAYGYDALRRLIEVEHSGFLFGAAPHSRYAFDKVGNRLYEEFVNDAIADIYNYDSAGRLTAEHRGAPVPATVLPANDQAPNPSPPDVFADRRAWVLDG